MQSEIYRILWFEGYWHIEFNGQRGPAFVTKEAAYDAACASAATFVKTGNPVAIYIDGSLSNDHPPDGSPTGFDAAS